MIYPIKVQYLLEYKLLITFSNGEKRVYDAQDDVRHGVFTALQNKVLFSRARIERGTVVWNDELDIAPEALYSESMGIPIATIAHSTGLSEHEIEKL